MAPTMVLLPAPLGPTTRFSFVPGYTVLSSYDKKFFILRMMQCARTHQRRTRISSEQRLHRSWQMLRRMPLPQREQPCAART